MAQRILNRVKRIMYSSGSVVTTDSIADIVLEFAKELAQLETSATVHIPAVRDDGAIHDVQLLLGPASQLVSVDEESAMAIDHEVEASALERVTTSIARLHPTATAVSDADLSATDPYET